LNDSHGKPFVINEIRMANNNQEPEPDLAVDKYPCRAVMR
jgi:hypothetical protein